MKLHDFVKETLWFLLVTATYVGAGVLSLRLASVSGFAAPMWVPTAIALVAVYFFGYRFFPAVGLGAFLVNLIMHAPVSAAVGIAFGNTIEAVLAVFLLRKIGFSPAIRRVRDAAGLIMLAGFVSTSICASIGILSLYVTGVVSTSQLGITWLAWWIGDAMAVLVLVPAIMVWIDSFSRSFIRLERIGELILLGAIAVILVLEIFVGVPIAGLAKYPLGFVVFPVVVWAALRFGQSGAVAITLLIAGVASIPTVLGHGYFAGAGAGSDVAEHLLLLQTYMGVIAVAGLILGAAIEQNRSAQIETEEARESLRIALETGRTVVWQWNWTAQTGWLPIQVQGDVDWLGGDGVMLQKLSREGMLSMVHPDDRARLERFEDWVIHGQINSFEEEFRIVRPGGEPHLISVRAKAVRDSGKDSFSLFGAALDVTRIKRIENQLTEAIRSREEISHDLKNSVNAILLSTDLLSEDESMTEENAVNVIRRSALAIQEMILSILDSGRLMEGKLKLEPSEVAPRDLVQVAIDRLRPLAAKQGVILNWKVQEGLKNFTCDSAKIQQVFSNIVGNAIQHSPRGGEVLLELERGDEGFLFAVSDHGPGIAAADVPRVFDRYWQSESGKKNGSGLGLFIARRIVEAHGGRIWVESKPGLGSKFCFTLRDTI